EKRCALVRSNTPRNPTPAAFLAFTWAKTLPNAKITSWKTWWCPWKNDGSIVLIIVIDLRITLNKRTSRRIGCKRLCINTHELGHSIHLVCGGEHSLGGGARAHELRGTLRRKPWLH